MIPRTISTVCRSAMVLIALPASVFAQLPPYDVVPSANPPYFRVRYEASTQAGELVYPVNYTVWIPNDVKSLRGVIVHQHGCGEGSCKSGLTGAYDLHWQSLAKKHDCALLAPSYEQPEKAECQMWCDPRNGSSAAFQKCLADLGAKSGHPELSKVPWALWGHSGGGHWAGGMVLLHPERVAAAWLRSGVPLLQPNPERTTIKYVQDTALTDSTPPPAPTNLHVTGNELSWEAEADLESGLASFIIERDGQFLANVPEQGKNKNPFGRPIFQGLQYSDTPTQPLVPLQFTDIKVESGKQHVYCVIAVNTVGLKSKPSADSVAGGAR